MNSHDISADRLAADIDCVRDEIARRKRTYPNLVRGRQMTAETAEYELGRMMAVLGTLQRVGAPNTDAAQGKNYSNRNHGVIESEQAADHRQRG